MSDEKEQVTPAIQKLREVSAGKAVSVADSDGRHLREGVKPSAPENFALPKPVAIPQAPVASSSKKEEQK